MKQTAITSGAAIVIAALLMVFLPLTAGAGDLEPGAAPGSTMHTLDEIYDLVDNKCGAATFEGAPVEKTGQTTCYDADGTVISCTGTGQDGDHQAGVAWPSPRFTDNADGTVTDNLTGLVWLKNANCFGSKTWASALADCNTLNSGECGLSDGSAEGDWRLPNVKELQSLTDFSNYGPALTTGHPFTNVLGNGYWSGTSYAYSTDSAWYVSMNHGYVYYYNKSNYYYVWPVRSDN